MIAESYKKQTLDGVRNEKGLLRCELTLVKAKTQEKMNTETFQTLVSMSRASEHSTFTLSHTLGRNDHAQYLHTAQWLES